MVKMACKQEVLNLSITGDIVQKAVKSFGLSKKYVQIMVRSSLLNILYQRMVLNESDLKIKKFDNTPFVVFKRRNVKDPLLQHFNSWAKGIVDAINKNYLKEIFLFLTNPADNEVIETYRFYLKYIKNENCVNSYSSEDVKEDTLGLLQVICDLGKCKKLGEHTNVSLELTYYDSTPEIYEPPGFEESLRKYCLSPDNYINHLATLKTGFHKVACYGSGLVFTERYLTPAGLEDVLNEGQQTVQEALEEDMAVDIQEENNEVNQKISTAKTSPVQLEISNITVSDHAACENNSSSASIVMVEDSCNCICQLSVIVGVDIISCFTCKKRYHVPCHGYLSKEDAFQTTFVCICCNTTDQCDQILLHFDKKDRYLLARVRKDSTIKKIVIDKARFISTPDLLILGAKYE